MTYKQAPANRNIDVNHLGADIASSGKRPLINRRDDVFDSPKPPSNGKPWSLGADEKAGFSSNREKSVKRYLTESGNQIRN
tara:strand:+ start:563 stop:805 length:243 start_codon:yes stop_codon:yes gene_type:complete